VAQGEGPKFKLQYQKKKKKKKAIKSSQVPEILATLEAEIRKIMVQGQPGK
jgi:hypothetical protein